LLFVIITDRRGRSNEGSYLEECLLWVDLGRYAETGLTGSWRGGEKYCGGEDLNVSLSGLSSYLP